MSDGVMLFNKSGLRKFPGQDPIEWFEARGLNYSTHAIGFNLQHLKTFKSEHFDYPFNSEAIKTVMSQLAVGP